MNAVKGVTADSLAVQNGLDVEAFMAEIGIKAPGTRLTTQFLEHVNAFLSQNEQDMRLPLLAALASVLVETTCGEDKTLPEGIPEDTLLKIATGAWAKEATTNRDKLFKDCVAVAINLVGGTVSFRRSLSQPQSKPKCAVCRKSEAHCTCPPPVPKGKRVIPQPRQPDPIPPKRAPRKLDEEEDDDDDAPTEEEPEEEDEENQENEEEEEDDEEELSLEDPGVLLEPKKWRNMLKKVGALLFHRAFRNFYSDVGEDRHHDEVFMSDVLLECLRALVSSTPGGATEKALHKQGSRIIARYEFFRQKKILGVEAAAATEAEINERSLPQTIRHARRRGEKRAEQSKRTKPKQTHQKSSRNEPRTKGQRNQKKESE